MLVLPSAVGLPAGFGYIDMRVSAVWVLEDIACEPDGILTRHIYRCFMGELVILFDSQLDARMLA